MSNETAAARKPVRRKVIAPIGTEAFASQQLSLFQQFLANSGDEREILSNAVDLWDRITLKHRLQKTAGCYLSSRGNR